MDQWTPTRLGSIRVKSHLKLSRNSGVQTDRILCSLFAPPFLDRWHLPEKGHTFTGPVGFLIVLWGSGNMWWSIYKSQIAADTEVTGTYLKNCEVLFCDRSLCWAILRFIQSYGTEWAPETPFALCRRDEKDDLQWFPVVPWKICQHEKVSWNIWVLWLGSSPFSKPIQKR